MAFSDPGRSPECTPNRACGVLRCVQPTSKECGTAFLGSGSDLGSIDGRSGEAQRDVSAKQMLGL